MIVIITPSAQRQYAIAALEKVLDLESYPLAELDVKLFGDEGIEIEATLMATSISGE
ncbi:MAG: hypothetical protein WC982_01035 [Advenella sp.]